MFVAPEASFAKQRTSSGSSMFNATVPCVASKTCPSYMKESDCIAVSIARGYIPFSGSSTMLTPGDSLMYARIVNASNRNVPFETSHEGTRAPPE